MKKEIFYRLSPWLGPLGCALIGTYFISHIIGGNHGLLAWKRVHHDLVIARKVLAIEEERQAKLEKNVLLLRSDPDLLEQQAMERFGLFRPDARILSPS